MCRPAAVLILVVAGIASGGCGRLGFDARASGAMDASGTDAGASDAARTDAAGTDAGAASGCVSDAGADAATPGTIYYVSPTGSDTASGTRPTEAWRTFARAWMTVVGDDTLVLLPGRYTEQLAPGSGTPGHPITIRADHDGSAIIDGESLRNPCSFSGSVTSRRTDLVVEGLRCISSAYTDEGGESSVLVYYADRIVLRRVTATDADDAVFGIFSASNVLVEDCAANGVVSNVIQVSSSHDVTLRRCFGRLDGGEATYHDVFLVDDSSDCRIENCVATAADPSAGVVSGFTVYSTAGVSNRNVLSGNVSRGAVADAFLVSGGTHRTEGNVMRDCVSLDGQTALFQRTDAALSVVQSTFVRAVTGISVGPGAPPFDADFAIGLAVSRSVMLSSAVGVEFSASPLITGVTSSDTVFHSVTAPYRNAAMPGPGDTTTLDPSYDTARYGDGAYLVRPPALATAGADGTAVGAEVLYRIVDGVLTTEPLWPWPLEERIRAELGVSVTYEDRGGLFRELPALTCR